jgi:glycosyltransferase involved in cell wall biosynthesis
MPNYGYKIRENYGSRKMIFLMDLPNPVHGMSNVNLSVLNWATKLSLKPKVINTVPSYASKYFNTKLWGGGKVLHTCFCYIQLFFALLLNIGGVIYRPINGGNGQVYDLIYILLCRLFNNKIYIHHHSFNYLNSKSYLFTVLNKFAGTTATHIVLGARMGALLTDLYGINENKVQVVSNLAFFEVQPSDNTASNAEQIKIGHLANLCVEKGVDLFIDICRSLHSQKINFSAVIAGPCVDETTKELVLDAVKELPQLKYVGPLYAKDKELFYQSLDCFIFPSKYKNEAEPLVLYEAALNGTYLVGSRQGCMKDVIESLAGFSVADGAEVVEKITEAILLEKERNGFSIEGKVKRLAYFQREQIKGKESLLSFINEMGRYELSETR